MKRKQVFWSYKKARKFVRALKLNNSTHWAYYSNNNLSGLKPKEIPAAPKLVYSKTGEWVSWEDFLGNHKISKKST